MDLSNNNNHTHIHPEPTMLTLATVELTSSKAPVLTTGDLTPAVTMDFENATQDFSLTKSVPLDKQVVLILPGIKDICIYDWITADCACIAALSFADFIKELHKNYLQNDLTKFTIKSPHPPSLHLANPFGIGLSSSCPSTAFSAIPHLFSMTLPSATTFRLIWMMSWKKRSNTARPRMIKSSRLGLLLSVFSTKPLLPRTNNS